MGFKKYFAEQFENPTGFIGELIAKVMNKKNAFINELTIELMNIQDNDQILEIGFGNGKFIREMANQANNGFMGGIDISDTMVKQAKKRNEDLIQQGRVEVKRSGKEKIPYNDESFDKICTINTVYFWEKPEEYLREIRRVLKTDGYVFISLRTKEKMKQLSFTKYNFTLYDYEDVKSLLQKSGFENIHYEHKPDQEFDALCVIAKKQLLN